MIKLNIGIIDADLLDRGTRFPNLALEKISAYYKRKENNMKKCDIEFGMKVIPYQKTAKGWEGLENSSMWKDAIRMKQPYLYLNNFEKGENAYILGICMDDGNDGDYFNPEDFEPYQEI